MARSRPIAVVALLTGALVACEPVDQPMQPDLESALARSAPIQPASSYIVIFGDQVPAGRVPDVANEMARLHAASVTFTYRHAVRGFAAVMAPGRAAELAADPRVRLVEPDQIARVGPGPQAPPPGKGKPGGGDEGDACSPTGQQTTPWGISRVGGGAPFSGSARAWIIDTGIDLDHCDLNVDAGASVNFITKGKNSPEDGHGHGTHVAGTVAAADNGLGVVGVAPGATVVAVRVLDNRGSGSYSGVIAGVDHVAANGQPGDVANMSLGGPPSQALDEAVLNAAAAGIHFVLAAGNESTHAGTRSPARTNGNRVYTVSAVDSGDRFASFSNYGNPPVDYAAPGVSIYSTYRGGGYATMSGTSMAAPHVAGILLWGSIGTDGTAGGDPDGSPDPIAVR